MSVYYDRNMLFNFCYLNNDKHIRTANLYDIYIRNFILGSSRNHHTREYINQHLRSVLIDYINCWGAYAYYLYYALNLDQDGFKLPPHFEMNKYLSPIYPQKAHTKHSARYFFKHYLNKVVKAQKHLSQKNEFTEDELRDIYMDIIY